jgi:hypothetical protein
MPGNDKLDLYREMFVENKGKYTSVGIPMISHNPSVSIDKACYR